MRIAATIVAAAMTTGAFTSGQPPPHGARGAGEQEARAFIAEIEAAMNARDRATIEHMIANDFVFVHSTGRTESRQSFIDRASAGALMSQRIEGQQQEAQLRLYGDTAAVWTTRTIVKPPDKEEMNLWTVNVYVKASGCWQWVSAQSTPVQK